MCVCGRVSKIGSSRLLTYLPPSRASPAHGGDYGEAEEEEEEAGSAEEEGSDDDQESTIVRVCSATDTRNERTRN